MSPSGKMDILMKTHMSHVYMTVQTTTLFVIHILINNYTTCMSKHLQQTVIMKTVLHCTNLIQCFIICWTTITRKCDLWDILVYCNFKSFCLIYFPISVKMYILEALIEMDSTVIDFSFLLCTMLFFSAFE